MTLYVIGAAVFVVFTSLLKAIFVSYSAMGVAVRHTQTMVVQCRLAACNQTGCVYG